MKQAVGKRRIFISYSRADLQFVRQFRDDLLGAGLTVWHDLKDLGAGLWWSQIEDAIVGREAIEHMVLVVSPSAIASRIVEREWRVARREGKSVSPVIPPAHKGKIDFASLPKWMRAEHFYDLTLSEQYEKLVDVLSGPGQQPKRPMMAPALPDGFVHRSAEFERLKGFLVDAHDEAVAVTAALQGAGGFGKTVLASKIARDEEIQDAFYDGVLWVTLGERPNLVQIISEVIFQLTEERLTFIELNASVNRLKEILEHRRCLLIIDDVWQEVHLRPLLDGAPSTTRLVNTRRDDIVPAGTRKVVVDAMTGKESVELLAGGLGDLAAPHRTTLSKLAGERLGDWPILLGLVNRFLRTRVQHGESLGAAIARVLERLDRRGLNAFNRELESERAAAIDSTVGASLELLAEFDKGGRPLGFHAELYRELAVFPEDVEVPIATIARLWALTADVGNMETEELLERFSGLALLQTLDLKRRTVRLHDVMRKYLGDMVGAMNILVLHKHVVAAYLDVSGPEIPDGEERRYFFAQYPSHLAHAGEREVLDGLLIDPQWIQWKLDELGSPLPLVSDYDQHARSRLAILIGRTLRLISSICARDRRQLLPQLVGRLMSLADPATLSFLNDARRLIIRPAILTLSPSLTAPGAEIARIPEAHPRLITAIAALPDGRLASTSDDCTIRLWDIAVGVETARFQGHTYSIQALAMLPDGRLASAGMDHSILLWDLIGGADPIRLEGHEELVSTLIVLPDGRLASGSWDATVRLWDIATGEETVCLRSRSGKIGALAALPDGRLASASDDRTILLWDLQRSASVLNIEAPSAKALLALSGGRLASGGRFDGAIRIWDLAKGIQTQLLEGHTDSVNQLALLPNGRLISASHDGTIRLWNIETGAEGGCISGDGSVVDALAVFPDGRFASASRERIIRLWELDDSLPSLPSRKSTERVRDLVILPSGEVASCTAGEDFVRLWDATSFLELGKTNSHIEFNRHEIKLLDGRCALASDNEIVLLDQGLEVGRLKGHGDRLSLGENLLGGASVTQLAILPNGHLASSSNDSTVRVWDVSSGVEILKLEGHSGAVKALAVLQDGRLVSGSRDNTIRIWDSNCGAELACLVGHIQTVTALSVLSTDRLASCSLDRTVRIWDIAQRIEIACLEVDISVTALISLPNDRLVVGDQVGQLHWLEML